jgi:hypothetical protein
LCRGVGRPRARRRAGRCGPTYVEGARQTLPHRLGWSACFGRSPIAWRERSRHCRTKDRSRLSRAPAAGLTRHRLRRRAWLAESWWSTSGRTPASTGCARCPTSRRGRTSTATPA